MLTRAENETLTRVGPGTPMGNVLRQYWLPAVFSYEVAADGDPLRIRLLGEDLLAFRASDGRVGIVEPLCPHRGAGLFFGRNEECGLRCVYHGWKFDVDGRCIDMPSEPEESSFKDKVRLGAYPTRERNGVVWTYMGPRAEPPELPALEWNLVPPSQLHASKRMQESNWIQALEGGIDPAHAGFLHAPLGRKLDPRILRERYFLNDRHPRFELVDTPYGVRIGTRRNAEPGRYYWSITHYMAPYYNAFAFFDGQEQPSMGSFGWVPMDDVTTMAWCFTWNPARPLSDDEIRETYYLEQIGGGVHVEGDRLLPPTQEPGGAFRPAANRGNDYLIDRRAQRTTRFAGPPGMSAQDAALQESMGAIFDRTREHLGTSDATIIRMRRTLLQAARALAESGTVPAGVDAPETYRVRPAGIVLDASEDWSRAADGWINGKELTAPVLL
jgi:nitrite reductase/ring-hydroxylating ferredoxin subunit